MAVNTYYCCYVSFIGTFIKFIVSFMYCNI